MPWPTTGSWPHRLKTSGVENELALYDDTKLQLSSRKALVILNLSNAHMRETPVTQQSCHPEAKARTSMFLRNFQQKNYVIDTSCT